MIDIISFEEFTEHNEARKPQHDRSNNTLQTVEDAFDNGILDKKDLTELRYIYKLIEKGYIRQARNSISKLDTLAYDYSPIIKDAKIEGHIMVKFEMESNDLNNSEMEEKIRNEIKSSLSKEYGDIKFIPLINTFTVD